MKISVNKRDREMAITSLWFDICDLRKAARIGDRRSLKLAERMRQEADEWEQQYVDMMFEYRNDYPDSTLDPVLIYSVAGERPAST